MAKSRISVEFKYHLASAFKTERLRHGFDTVEELSVACHIPVLELMQLEIGKISNRHIMFRLAKFYKKQIRIALI